MDDEARNVLNSFGRNSAAGNILKKLYGCKQKNCVTYPKVNIMTDTERAMLEEKKKGWNIAVLSEESTRNLRERMKVQVPKFVKKENRKRKIFPRRKNKMLIQRELREIRNDVLTYRPAFTEPRNTEKEKDRLAKINCMSQFLVPVGDSTQYVAPAVDYKTEQEELMQDKCEVLQEIRQLERKISRAKDTVVKTRLLVSLAESQKELADVELLLKHET